MAKLPRHLDRYLRFLESSLTYGRVASCRSLNVLECSSRISIEVDRAANSRQFHLEICIMECGAVRRNA